MYGVSEGPAPWATLRILVLALFVAGSPQLALAQPAAAAPPPAPSAPAAPDLSLDLLGSRLGQLAPPGMAPCVAAAQLSLGGRTYVACGDAGVWIVELAADATGDRLLEVRSVGGRAVDLFVRGGRVWVERLSPSAAPLESVGAATSLTESPYPAGTLPESPPDIATTSPPDWALPPRPPKAPVPSPSSAPAPPLVMSGRVLSSDGGEVVVDLGRDHGVNPGSHVEFSVMIEERGPLGVFARREVLAVGLVTSSTDERSLVGLGVGEVVPIGAEAVSTSRRLTRSRSSPPRVAGVWTVSAMVRPFFVLDELGVGALNEISVAYQSRGSLRYQLVSSPLAFAAAGDGATFAALLVGLLSYDSRLFEIGLGAGVQTVNDGDYEPGSGMTISQSLRFGALDGLNISLRNDISLFHREFDYSAFNGQVQIPVADRAWLVFGGGGGTVGYGFFEAGGRVLLVGNGTSGSLFLRGTIGYAALFENPSSGANFFDENGFLVGSPFEDLYYGGPLIGVGIEYRR